MASEQFEQKQYQRYIQNQNDDDDDDDDDDDNDDDNDNDDDDDDDENLFDYLASQKTSQAHWACNKVQVDRDRNNLLTLRNRDVFAGCRTCRFWANGNICLCQFCDYCGYNIDAKKCIC